jgi:hypothetical protein
MERKDRPAVIAAESITESSTGEGVGGGTRGEGRGIPTVDAWCPIAVLTWLGGRDSVRPVIGKVLCHHHDGFDDWNVSGMNGKWFDLS